MPWSYLVVLALPLVVACCFAWGWFEAGWLRERVLEVHCRQLPEQLDGLTIAHLSDFHLGHAGRGADATRRAVDWVVGRRPDIVVVTGDLVSRPRGERLLGEILRRLGRPYVVLGNHDVAVTRDPFSRTAELDDLHEHASLLRDEGVTIELESVPVQIAGVDALTYPAGTARPERLVDARAAFRILLCHFPSVVHRLPAGAFHLVLAGHLHAGQISLPTPFGRIATAHPRAPYLAGLYDTPAGLLHVSPGTGTTFVPFRFCARPEVTELVLRHAA